MGASSSRQCRLLARIFSRLDAKGGEGDLSQEGRVGLAQVEDYG
jgi:hypothetical protein